MITLTMKQRECLDFIKLYVADHDGMAPAYTDIMDALGIGSKAGAHRLVIALEERGHIRRVPHRARCIEVIDQRPQAETILHGLVRAIGIGDRRAIDRFCDRAFEVFPHFSSRTSAPLGVAAKVGDGSVFPSGPSPAPRSDGGLDIVHRHHDIRIGGR